MTDKTPPNTPLPTTTTYTNPLNNIIIGKKNQSNISNILDLIDQNKIGRTNFSIYISGNIVNAWRLFCRTSGKSTCWTTEEALLEYMKNHPSSQVQFNLTRNIQVIAPDVQHRIKVKILVDEIKTNLQHVKSVKAEGRGSLRSTTLALRKSCLKASKLSSTDPDLLNILEEAEAHLI